MHYGGVSAEKGNLLLLDKKKHSSCPSLCVQQASVTVLSITHSTRVRNIRHALLWSVQGYLGAVGTPYMPPAQQYAMSSESPASLHSLPQNATAPPSNHTAQPQYMR